MTSLHSFRCRCDPFIGHTKTEARAAEIMGLPVSLVHNFMDAWDDAFDEARCENLEGYVD